MPADTVYLAVATICGGAAIKVVDYVFGAPRQRSDITLAEKKAVADEERSVRTELRAEAQRYRDELTRTEIEAAQMEQRLRSECDGWRQKFYEANESLVTEKHAAIGKASAAVSMPAPKAASLLQTQVDQMEIAALREQVAQLQRSNDELVARIRAQNK